MLKFTFQDELFPYKRERIKRELIKRTTLNNNKINENKIDCSKNNIPNEITMFFEKIYPARWLNLNSFII